jgi:hypothetical protein
MTDHLSNREKAEIAEDVALDDEISSVAQRSGYSEKDAVEVVRHYRREKTQSSTNRRGEPISG